MSLFAHSRPVDLATLELRGVWAIEVGCDPSFFSLLLRDQCDGGKWRCWTLQGGTKIDRDEGKQEKPQHHVACGCR